MKFNPATKCLYTDEGRFLKQLACPLRRTWRSLSDTAKAHIRHCDACDHTVTDTAAFDDQGLLAYLRDHPDACLKVDLRQANLTVLAADEL